MYRYNTSDSQIYPKVIIAETFTNTLLCLEFVVNLEIRSGHSYLGNSIAQISLIV